MRAVILGSDLMYDKSGRLIPIEINTNVGYDSTNRVESAHEWLDLSNLVNFVQEKKVKRVVLDISSSLRRSFRAFEFKLRKALEGIAEVETIEGEYEDAEDSLYIRVKFSYEAVVDSYCKDKIAFLNMISKSSKIAQEFLYKEGGEVKGTMDDFLNNGEDPNYIVKYRYPQYESSYPKYYKLKSLKAVQKLAESLEDDYFIMPCYLNETNMYKGERFVLFRQWSLIVPDEEKVLRAIDMGSYTKLSGKVDRSLNKFDEKTGELLEGRINYSSKNWMRNVTAVLLEEGDQVLMADGTWKDIKSVKAGDEVLSVDVPHTEDIDIRKHTGNLNITVKELEEDSKYTVNEVKYKSIVEGFQDIVHMTFEEDQEEWWDTEDSSYLTLDSLRKTVEFKEIKYLKVGDKIYLIALNKNSNKVEYVERTIKKIWVERKLETGYTLSLDGSHLFITKSPESTAGYVSIEHNAGGGDDPEGQCEAYCQDRYGVSLRTIACSKDEAETILEDCTPICAMYRGPEYSYKQEWCECYCIYVN